MRALGVEAVTFDVGSTLLADPKGEKRRQQSRALKHWLKDHGIVDKDDRRRVLAVAAGSWSASDLEAARLAKKVAESIVASLRFPVVESERQRLEALLIGIYEDGPYYAADGVQRVLLSLAKLGLRRGPAGGRSPTPGGPELRRGHGLRRGGRCMLSSGMRFGTPWASCGALIGTSRRSQTQHASQICARGAVIGTPLGTPVLAQPSRI